jgi:hypothetical protein
VVDLPIHAVGGGANLHRAIPDDDAAPLKHLIHQRLIRLGRQRPAAFRQADTRQVEAPVIEGQVERRAVKGQVTQGERLPPEAFDVDFRRQAVGREKRLGVTRQEAGNPPGFSRGGKQMHPQVADFRPHVRLAFEFGNEPAPYEVVQPALNQPDDTGAEQSRDDERQPQKGHPPALSTCHSHGQCSHRGIWGISTNPPQAA